MLVFVVFLVSGGHTVVSLECITVCSAKGTPIKKRKRSIYYKWKRKVVILFFKSSKSSLEFKCKVTLCKLLWVFYSCRHVVFRGGHGGGDCGGGGGHGGGDCGGGGGHGGGDCGGGSQEKVSKK